MQLHQTTAPTAPTATQLATALASVLGERQGLVLGGAATTQGRLQALAAHQEVLLAQLAVLLPPDQSPLMQSVLPNRAGA